MKTFRNGFTLLEVLIATIVVTVGLLGLASAIGLSASLAGHGRSQGRAALLLQSRADLLRQEVLAAGPGCAVPAAGFRAHAPSVIERWSASASGGIVEFVIQVEADSLGTRMACP
jgi:prepilin-type N-terminal cleavage/methylation domain-containing protein